MSNAFARQAVSYETESSWAEDTSTFGTRLQTLNSVDVSGLEYAKQDLNITKQYQHEGTHDVLTVYGGSFTVSLPLTGHGGTTATSLTETDLAALLGNVIGNSDTSAVGTAADGTGDKTGWGVDGGTIPDGTVIRLGEAGDSRGNGNFIPVDNLATGTLTPLLEPDDDPSDGDVVYAAQIIHPNETPGTAESVTSTRWLIGSANQQYACHGCFPTSISFSDLSPNGTPPTVDITFQVSRWTHSSATFPDTTSTDAKDPVPLTRGSMAIQDRGTTTRATYSLRQLSISIDLQVQPIMGQSGVVDGQVVVGAKRLSAMLTGTMTFDAEAAGTQTWYDKYSASSPALQQIMWTGSKGDGTAIGLYIPSAKLISPAPTQRDVENLNRIQVAFAALTDADTTSELTLSAWRLALS